MHTIQVTFRNIIHSDTIEARVRERGEKLWVFDPRITMCSVVLEAPHRHQHTGRRFKVSIDVMIPGRELAIGHSQTDSASSEDLESAITHAFAQMTRRLKGEHGRRGRRREGRRAIAPKLGSAV